MFNVDTHLILPSLLWPDLTLVNNNYRASKAPGSALQAPLMAALQLIWCPSVSENPLYLRFRRQVGWEYAQPPPHFSMK